MNNEVNSVSKRVSPKVISSIAAGVFIIAIILLLVIFFCSNKTTTTGKYEGKIVSSRVSCTSNELEYLYFRDNKADKKELKIDTIFKNDELYSIFLTYKLYHLNEGAIRQSEANNHAAMNLSFINKGLGPDALKAKYDVLEDNFQFSIYAENEELTGFVPKYFLLESGNMQSLSKESVANYYRKMNMTCEIIK